MNSSVVEDEAAGKVQRGASGWRPWLLSQYVVAGLLAVTLGFIVTSNCVGWTAQLQVTAVQRTCPRVQCQQRVFVKGRKQAFVVSPATRVQVGDRVEIHGKCTPRCELTFVSVARAFKPDYGSLLSVPTSIYSHLFVPTLPVIATIQTTLTGIVPIVSVAFLAQLLFPAVRRRPKFLRYEMWLDVIYLLQTQLMYMTVLGVAVGTTAWWLKQHTPVLFPSLSEWPLWLQVLLALWMYDFVVYWRHRLEHQVFFLWPIHAVHHTTTAVDVLTTTRLHFLELMLGGVLNMWITARFGISPHAAGIGFMLYLNHNYYVHTNVKIVYPGFLKYVFVSPFMHRWHHAKNERARDKNFGVVFAWNDWLFGTALHPDREPTEYGIDYPPGEVAKDSYLAHQLYPLKVLVVRLMGRLRPERRTALGGSTAA